MKVIHGSLKGLLAEVKDRKVESVRVAAFMQGDAVSNGVPRYTAWVVVTAVLDWDLWAEWRLLVGRGHSELTETGAVVPARIAERMAERGKEVGARVTEAGLGVRDGLLAHDAESMGRRPRLMSGAVDVHATFPSRHSSTDGCAAGAAGQIAQGAQGPEARGPGCAPARAVRTRAGLRGAVAAACARAEAGGAGGGAEPDGNRAGRAAAVPRSGAAMRRPVR